MLAPAVVPVNLRSGPHRSGEELPFAPVGEPAVADAEPERSVLAPAAAFRWRRPLMIVLAVAVAASVALASQRTSNVDSDGRASGSMNGTASGDAPTGSVEDERASQAVGDAAELRAAPEEGRTGSESAESSDRDVVPLDVTVLSSTPSRGDGAGATGSSTTGSTARGPATTAAVVTSSIAAAGASSTAYGTGDTTVRQTTSARRSATGQATTPTELVTASDTTTTGASTTARRPTTTERTTTTRPTTATVVLIGGSAGGFDSPSIEQDMVWLDNGDVGRWRSTNGDIQLMRSGFEGIESIDGGQFAELNSSSQGGLHRSLTVDPGTTIEWEFLHRARSGTEQIEIRIDGGGSGEEIVGSAQATTQWVTQRGSWRVPDGVTSVRFMLWSTKSGAYGNLVDAVQVVAAESPT